MKKYFYLLLIPLCLGFAACGSDDEDEDLNPNMHSQSDPSTATEENNDLIGWWKEPADNSGYVAIGNAYTFIRHALHFINSNIVEEAWVGPDEDVEDEQFPYGREYWKRAFNGWYYFTSWDYYTWVYKREGNVIRLEGATQPIVIVGDKLRWNGIEYERVTSK